MFDRASLTSEWYKNGVDFRDPGHHWSIFVEDNACQYRIHFDDNYFERESICRMESPSIFSAVTLLNMLEHSWKSKFRSLCFEKQPGSINCVVSGLGPTIIRNH